MFENVGRKIKSISKIFAWIGIVGGAIVALVGLAKIIDGLNMNYGLFALVGLIYMVIGLVFAVGSYLSSLCLCALGEITEDISYIRKGLNGKNMNRNNKKESDSKEDNFTEF